MGTELGSRASNAREPHDYHVGVVTKRRTIAAGGILLVALGAAGGALLLAHNSSSSIGKPPERLCTHRELATKTFHGDCVYRVGNHWERVSVLPPALPPSVSALLTVRVYLNRCTPVMQGPCSARRQYSLTCDPGHAGGTMPDPAAACFALTDLATHRYNGMSGCEGGTPYGGPSTAVVSGLVDHRSYVLDLQSDNSWCGDPPRALLRDYWILSTFPCSIPVTHQAGAGGPAASPHSEKS